MPNGRRSLASAFVFLPACNIKTVQFSPTFFGLYIVIPSRSAVFTSPSLTFDTLFIKYFALGVAYGQEVCHLIAPLKDGLAIISKDVLKVEVDLHV